MQNKVFRLVAMAEDRLQILNQLNCYHENREGSYAIQILFNLHAVDRAGIRQTASVSKLVLSREEAERGFGKGMGSDWNEFDDKLPQIIMKEEVANSKLKNIMLAFSLIGSCFGLATVVLMGVYDLTGFNLFPSTDLLCNSYLTSKYQLNRYNIFSAAFLLQLISTCLSFATSIFLIVKRQPRKGYMYHAVWSCLNLHCLIALYILFSCSVLGCGSAISYFLALMIEKGSCLDNILIEWATVFTLGLIAFLLLLACWAINIWLVRKEQLLNDACANVDEISFGCDNPTYFQTFHQEHQNNGPILQRKTNPVRQNSVIKQLKNDLQKIKRSIAHNNTTQPGQDHKEQEKIADQEPSKTDRQKENNQKIKVNKEKFVDFIDDPLSSEAGSPRNKGNLLPKGDKNQNSSNNSHNKTAILDDQNKNAQLSLKPTPNSRGQRTGSPKNGGKQISISMKGHPKSPKHPQSARKEQSNSNDNLIPSKFLASISYNKLPSEQSSVDPDPSHLKKIASQHKLIKKEQFSPEIQNPYNKFIKEDEIKQEQLQLLIFSKLSQKINEDSLVYEKKRSYGENRNKLFKDMLPEPKEDRWDKKKGQNTNNRQVDQEVLSFLRQKFLG